MARCPRCQRRLARDRECPHHGVPTQVIDVPDPEDSDSGETLATWMEQHGERGGLGEIVAMLSRFARALSVLHARGSAHGALRPERVAIDSGGVRLLDGAPGTHDVFYDAPEQRAGLPVDGRADIYAFGAIAFEMIAGHPPFAGDRRTLEHHHRCTRPPSIRETRDIPEALDELILRCLAKDPSERPQTADELATLVSQALAAGSSAPRTKVAGTRELVAVAWIQGGGDPFAIASAVAEAHGVIARHFGDVLVAAFAAEHASPVADALAAARAIHGLGCGVVIHVGNALVRRVGGRLTLYADEIDRPARWTPVAPVVGVLLTGAAAELLDEATSPAEIAGFFRAR